MANDPEPLAIMWFRKDLRLYDNPAFVHSAKDRVLPLFILDDQESYHQANASKWWLYKSLNSLKKSLNANGLELVLRRGNPLKIFQDLVSSHKVSGLYWNRCYDPYAIARDKKIKEFFKPHIDCQSFNASLLTEPWALKTQAGTPYQIFTSYWKALKSLGNLGNPFPLPLNIKGNEGPIASDNLERWGLYPTSPDWSQGLEKAWSPGEEEAKKKLSLFLENDIYTYHINRDFPSQAATSQLSPHLHWGEIGPRQIWQATLNTEPSERAWSFLSEIAWREFSYYMLYYFPELPSQPLRKSFNDFPWRNDYVLLRAWQKGMTGYPLIDAGMRQLWETGWMHNRVRMITASFLVKNLLISWQEGEAWFYDTLVDADLANNSMNWQWVAGCGVDAAPYFRIFNPILQGQKFDSEGRYVRRWVPELSALPDKYIHNPWEAPTSILESAKLRLGHTYPYPIVDHKKSRVRALEAFNVLKSFS
jgi:deoxyribodipyrimidine photo-lyase